MERFEQSRFFTPFVGSGSNGRVYSISEGLVAKVDRYDSENHIRIEFEKALDLFNCGISTPKPEGVFYVRINWFGLKASCFRIRPAFVMQKIRGYVGKKVPHKHLQHARELLSLQIHLCERNGFYRYHHDKN